LNFGLSPDFSVQIKVSLSERLSQKLVTQCISCYAEHQNCAVLNSIQVYGKRVQVHTDPMNMLLAMLSRWPRYFSQGPAGLMWSVVHFPFTYHTSTATTHVHSLTTATHLHVIINASLSSETHVQSCQMTA